MRNAEYYRTHRVSILSKQAVWYQSHKLQVLRYHQTHREQDNVRRIKMRKTHKLSVKQSLMRRLRTRLWHCLRGRKSQRTIDLLGCSIETFKEHIEGLFKPNMTWDNRGEWQLDHIRPLSSFDLEDLQQQKLACHYTNIQPLWAAENLAKSNRYETPKDCA